MKRLTHSFPAKVAAIILSVIMLALCILSVISIAYMADYDYYTEEYTDLRESSVRSLMLSEADDIYWRYTGHSVSVSRNLLYTIADAKNTVLYSNFSDEALMVSYTVYFYSYEDANGYGRTYTTLKDEFEEDPQYIITVALPKTLEFTDRYSLALNLTEFLYSMRYAIIVIAALSVIALVLLLVFLYCAAGKHKDENAPRLNRTDKIPLDLYALAVAFFVGIEYSILCNIYVHDVVMIIFGIAVAAVDWLILLHFTMSIATRLKTKTSIIRGSVIYRFLMFLVKICRRIISSLKRNLNKAHLVWKNVLITVALLFIDFIFLMMAFNSWGSGPILFWSLINGFLLIALVVAVSHGLYRIKKDSAEIAGGNFEFRSETDKLFGDFKQLSENLNSISSGMSVAVEERMKSERFKTELITNVSHDIKTPLTSIINYVDLLKKEDLQNAQAAEYLEVLDRQSARLKKLTEDLVEASKASAGTVAVTLSPCELGVMLAQSQAEYEERLATSGLEVILSQPEKPVIVSADGRHLWRVFDNLLSNICKYAMPGTRVYITLEQFDKKVLVTFRNISRYALNISSDELFERFTRGDSSRNTEGSGLGLSIARSLTELQNGTLDISIDGDLFKATLTLSSL